MVTVYSRHAEFIKVARNAVIAFPLQERRIDALYNVCLQGIRFRGIPASDRNIAERGNGLVAAAHGFFRHAAQDFAGQTDGVIFVHPFNDAFNQGTKWAVHHGFGNTDNFYVITLEHGLIYNGFLLVACEPAVFPDQDNVERVLLGFCPGNHFLESGAFGCSPSGNAVFHVNVGRGYDDIVFLGVVKYEAFLRVRRKLLLFVCRNADISGSGM